MSNVKLRDRAVVESNSRDSQRLVLNHYIFLRQYMTCFKGPKQDVGAGSLGRDRHQRVVVTGKRPPVVSICRLDTAPQTAPGVEFPCRVESDVAMPIRAL